MRLLKITSVSILSIVAHSKTQPGLDLEILFDDENLHAKTYTY